ncbi:sensor domain-containing protein [Paenibacillus rigui]|uniref:GGDEF domain-containing protein n=1 Tax=Paenibacillus rigui TaxID=554312 RepID=A0A229UTQ2_9BACL|nr:sensor domain-containing diguanylate cyclase [Paenibacillus rigui]OXM86896.1 GGDEF domain-containing protein [Paenibacillus rigui]
MDKGFQEHEAFFRQLVEQSSDLFQGISLHGITTYVSPSFYKIMGMPSSIVGKPCTSYITEMDTPLFEHAFHQMIQNHQPMCLDYRLQLPNGSLLWVEGKANIMYDRQGNPSGVALIARDIDKHKQLEQKLTHMAYYDSLTGLPNRRLFQDRYSQALLTAKRYQHRAAVLYLDLDDFKFINDTYGHAAGDELLKAVSSRLAHCVRDPDTVSRLGGDEFVILLQNFEHPDDIRKVGIRVIESLKQPYVIHSHTISITCSMGAAEYPQDGIDTDTLLQHADAAMYHAKQHGKNYFQS